MLTMTTTMKRRMRMDGWIDGFNLPETMKFCIEFCANASDVEYF